MWGVVLLKLTGIAGVVLMLAMVTGRPARAANPGGRLLFSRFEWTVRQSADQTWDTVWTLSGKAGAGDPFSLRYSALAQWDLSAGSFDRGWARADAQLRLDGCTITVPGKLEFDDGNTVASLDLVLEPRLPKGLAAQADLGYVRRWAGDGVSDYHRGLAGLHGSCAFAGRVLVSLDVQGSYTVYEDQPENDRLYGRVCGDCRYTIGPGSYIKARIGWTGFGFLHAPEDDRAYTQLALSFTCNPADWYLAVNLGGKRSTGRLAENNWQGEAHVRASTDLGPGTITLSTELDGIRHMDPATTAHDRFHWLVGGGYSCSLGNFSVDAQLFYASTHYDDGLVKWTLGPSLAVGWRPGKHWRLTARWAPEGDLGDERKGLQISVAWVS